MRLTFKKERFKYLFSNIASLFLSWIIPAFILVFVALGYEALGAKVSNDPTKLKNIYDLILLFSWVGSPIIASLAWILLKNETEMYRRVTSFFVYPVTLFFVSLIPLVIRDNKGTSVSIVKDTVVNTKVYFVALYVALFVGFILHLYLTRATLKKSNWWLFIVALPYLLTSMYAYHYQLGFIHFLNLKGFSYKTVSGMLKKVHFADVRVMNPMWFSGISLLIAGGILILGVLIGAFIWKKTEKWRRKNAKKYQKKKEKEKQVQASRGR